MIVHHTDCGLQGADDEEIRAVLRQATGGEGRSAEEVMEIENVVGEMRFGSFVR